ncbi:pathogenicity island chaperone protein SpiC [Yersinia frederiksenii]|nr:pathogenicity island chaperone protein SpiC [Yersinia frederiksenii]
MLEILKMQSLVRDIDFSDKNTVSFTLNEIPARAVDYNHSICVGVFFIEKKMISDSVIRYITLMLVALDDTQDFALQLKDGYWWFWCRYTIDDRDNIKNTRHDFSVKLEQIYAVVQHFNSMTVSINSSKSNILSENEKKLGKVIS